MDSAQIDALTRAIAQNNIATEINSGVILLALGMALGWSSLMSFTRR